MFHQVRIALGVSLALLTALGCGKVQEVTDAAKKLEEVRKAVSDFSGTVEKDMKPIDEKIKDTQDKAAKAAGEEKTKLESLLKDIGPIKEMITTKLGGLTNIKDLAELSKMKDEVTKLIAQLKDKLGMK
jgi:predicted  nucleic acid-binding Zn-ribbon protein